MLNKFGKLVTKGPRQGHCNICDAYGPLTEDHVPPKGTIRVTQVEMLHIVDLLKAEGPKTSRRISQNGVKFRSLCAKCNNHYLGTNYDPELISFTNQVATLLKTQISLPSSTKVRIRPGHVARAVLGHLLAVGIERRARGDTGNDVVDFFLDQNKPFPSAMNIYCWVYPYNRQVLVRDAGKFFELGAAFVVMWIMKYFPLGFMITWDQPKHLSFDLLNLKDYALISGGAAVEAPIRLKNPPAMHFPEEVEKNEMILYGDGAMGANEQQRNS